MKTSLKAVLTIFVLLIAPAKAFAQATTSVGSSGAPSAEKAEQMKNQSYSVRNPTEQNKTFRNQMNEQPDPKAPSAPVRRMVPTGAISDQMPISSPQHEKASRRVHDMRGMEGMKMSDH